MHTDENKKFDKRNIDRNRKDGIISQKDYEIYLSKLPDLRDRVFIPEEELGRLEDLGSKKEDEAPKRASKAKAKTKGK